MHEDAVWSGVRNRCECLDPTRIRAQYVEAGRWKSARNARLHNRVERRVYSELK